MVSIRPYEPADRDGLRRCIDELQEFERQLEPGYRHEADRISEKYLAFILKSGESETGRILIADDGTSPVGFASVWKDDDNYMLAKGFDRCCFVSDLVVLPDARGKGVGKLLLEAAEAWAREKGMNLMKLSVLAQNPRARNVYAKAGYREFDVTLLKDISGNI